MTEVSAIKAFNDNYIWCVHQQDRAMVVDPGDESPVLAFLGEHKLTLTDILITHHHYDHIDGLPGLLEAFPNVRIWGLASDRVKAVNRPVVDDELIHIDSLNLDFKVLSVPGHTRDHIAYYHPDMLFCGDTLFSAGCGRLFEGTPAQMQQSLTKLAALPDNTPVYCTHEYTAANVKFALSVEPDNPALNDYARWVTDMRQHNQPTLPSSIGREKQVNPFLRAHLPHIGQYLPQGLIPNEKSEVELFAALRYWKDQF